MKLFGIHQLSFLVTGNMAWIKYRIKIIVVKNYSMDGWNETMNGIL
jgi:hypothetical protein